MAREPPAEAGPFVAVIGLGGVGSHCAHALVRSGSVRRLRLVDFDRVSLSSLNRHAVATRRDVGVAKVVACADWFRLIAPGCVVDARDEMFTATAAEALLGPAVDTNEVPDIVVDCIDDVPTKADLLEACGSRGLRVVSALGSGAKGDPTKLCVARGLRDVENDALAAKMRQTLRSRGVDVSRVPFVYSSQKAVRALLPLTDDQKASPENFGNVANFRLRVIPVLGTQPALAGVAIAAQVLLELALPRECFRPRPSPTPKRQMAERFVDKLRKRESICNLDLTTSEALFLVHEVWRGRSALDQELSIATAAGIKFTLARWDPDLAARPDNLILCTEDQAAKHIGPAGVRIETAQLVESALSWARERLALPQPSSPLPVLKPTHRAAKTTPALLEARQQPSFRANMASWERNGITDDTEEAMLATEQLSRSSAFFANGHAGVCSAFVVIVGVGTVGSAAATLLLRAGVGRLRLVDGGVVCDGLSHASAVAAERGTLKVDVCKERLSALLPHNQIEAVAQNFAPATASQLLGPASANGRLPDLVVDCVGALSTKTCLIHSCASRGLRAVSVVASPGLMDPTRIALAPLAEAYASTAASALRLLVYNGVDIPGNGENMSAAKAFGKIDVVHSQEANHWTCETGESSQQTQFEPLVRLSLGITAAAVVLHRLADEELPAQPDSGTVGLWKRLERSFRQTCGMAPGLDTYTIGCVVEHIWRGRCALSRRSLPGGGGGAGDSVRLVRWDWSKPPDLANLVPLTEDEATAHEAACSITGSLPDTSLLLEGSTTDAGGDLPSDMDTTAAEIQSRHQQRLRVHRLLLRLRNHLENCQAGRCHGVGYEPVAKVGDSSAKAILTVEAEPFFRTSAATLATAAAVAITARKLQWGGSKNGCNMISLLVAVALGGTAITLAQRRSWWNLLSRSQIRAFVCPTPLPSLSSYRGRDGAFAGLVGETPLVELQSLSEATGCRIIAKAEFLSPGGCQKDRVARQILADAEEDGRLQPGGTVIEGTSGSTGISLSLAAAAKGYRVIIVMPDDQAKEKSQLIRFFGAEVEFVRPASISSPEHYVNVARRRAMELATAPGGALFADQFENPSNFRAHFVGTGPELWRQSNQSLDAFVMSAGTGGTLAGVGCYLKSVSTDVQVYLADVSGSSLYFKVAHGVLYAHEQAERTVRRHRTDTIAEGIGLDRLTKNLARGLPDHNGGQPGIDAAVRVTDQEALEMAHYLLAHEGVFIGSSAAVNCAAACKVAKRLGPGKTVATVLCDNGLRHLTKFYCPEVWPEYGLRPPELRRHRGDLSFLGP